MLLIVSMLVVLQSDWTTTDNVLGTRPLCFLFEGPHSLPTHSQYTSSHLTTVFINKTTLRQQRGVAAMVEHSLASWWETLHQKLFVFLQDHPMSQLWCKASHVRGDWPAPSDHYLAHSWKMRWRRRVRRRRRKVCVVWVHSCVWNVQSFYSLFFRYASTTPPWLSWTSEVKGCPNRGCHKTWSSDMWTKECSKHGEGKLSSTSACTCLLSFYPFLCLLNPSFSLLFLPTSP